MTASEELAEVVAKRRYEDLDSSAVRTARRLLLDFLGVGLSGSTADTGRLAAQFAAEMSGPGRSRILGHPGTVNAVHAAFANAICEHSIELDDVDVEALFHFGPPVVAAALATAEDQKSSGQELLAAIVAGGEAMNRISRATNNELRDRGFHTTPTCGAFGAAVAAAVLLGLDPDQTTSALGLAGAQASGLMEMYGISMQKRFNPGPAARNGVTAAYLARTGFTGAETILDGPRGFGNAFAGGFDLEKFRDGLGETIPFEVEFKPYSCARPIHNAIDAALELRDKHGLRPRDVRTMTVFRHPAWAHYHQIGAPRTFHEAQVSLPYAVAIALAEGQALPDQFRDPTQREAEVRDLSAGISIVADPSLARGVSCRVEAVTMQGQHLTVTVDHPRGSIERPLTDEELRTKFMSLACHAISLERCAELATAVETLDNCEDVNEFTHLLSASR